jgi:uracil-DNA glycosylase family 4
MDAACDLLTDALDVEAVALPGPFAGPFCHPDPGLDFLAHAQALGDPKPKKKKSALGRPAYHEPGANLLALYKLALYAPEFHLPVVAGGRPLDTKFIPGGRWGLGFSPRGPRPDARSEVVVVGKCGGPDEEAAGRNLVGPSGRELVGALREAGFADETFRTWYVTNVVRHGLLDPTSKNLAAGWVKNCLPLLQAELRLTRPKWVLCLGADAAKHVLGLREASVGALAGRPLTARVLDGLDEEGRPVWFEFNAVVVLHPAFTAANPERRPELVSALRDFRGRLAGEVRAEEVVDYAVVDTVEGLRAAVDSVLADHAASGLDWQFVSADAEWEGRNWTEALVPRTTDAAGRPIAAEKGEPQGWLRTFQFTHKPAWARLVVLRHGGRRAPDGRDPVGTPAIDLAAAAAELRRLFAPAPGRHVRAVGHNLKSDIPWLDTLDRELGRLVRLAYDAPPDDPGADGSGPGRYYGWQKARSRGGLDTMYAWHAVNETALQGLEVVAAQVAGMPRYDHEVEEDKARLALELKVAKGDLTGYGELAARYLYPYGLKDVDGPLRAAIEFVRPGGLLDCDRFGKPSWRAFWISQRKLLAEIEMETAGLGVDLERARLLEGVYRRKADELVAALREKSGWPDFNPGSSQQVRCVLFGPAYARKRDPKTGNLVDPRPEAARGALVLGLEPLTTTGKPPMNWERVAFRDDVEAFRPSTDKTTLSILYSRQAALGNETAADFLWHLRASRYVTRVVTGVLARGRVVNEAGEEEEGDEFDAGILEYVCPDGRIRTAFRPVETGRVGSSRPPIQNLSKRRETDLVKIMKEHYCGALRTFIRSRPGHVFVNADYTGAELAAMAILTGSKKMLEHCQRGNLPEDDPRHYDIHSNVAKQAFGFDGPPLKSWLIANGMENLRDIAKTITFGLPYGRGDEAILRGIEETGRVATMAQVQRVKDVLFGNYPELPGFFQAARERVTRYGWIRSPFGRSRRFVGVTAATPKKTLGDLERQAGNFDIQGTIADVMSTALSNLYRHPRADAAGRPRYTLVAQIHDDIMAEVPVPHVPYFVKEVLPRCLTEMAPITPCDLDGNPLAGREPVRLGFEWSLSEHWGQKLTRDRAREIGLAEEFWPKEKPKAK